MDIPRQDDLAGLYEIYSDHRVWTHFPTLRHTEPETTSTMLEGWIAAWARDGLGPWLVRLDGDDRVIGHAGCSLRPAGWWNLGYRFAADVHGRGLASEAARVAVEQAHAVRPEAPVIAYLLEHNVASRRVAEGLGLTLQHRGPDEGNPDPSAMRLVHADRELTDEQLAATLA